MDFPHYAVHTPIQPDPRFFKKYLLEGLDSAQAKYASLVEYKVNNVYWEQEYLDDYED